MIVLENQNELLYSRRFLHFLCKLLSEWGELTIKLKMFFAKTGFRQKRIHCVQNTTRSSGQTFFKLLNNWFRESQILFYFLVSDGIWSECLPIDPFSYTLLHYIICITGLYNQYHFNSTDLKHQLYNIYIVKNWLKFWIKTLYY